MRAQQVYLQVIQMIQSKNDKEIKQYLLQEQQFYDKLLFDQKQQYMRNLSQIFNSSLQTNQENQILSVLTFIIWFIQINFNFNSTGSIFLELFNSKYKTVQHIIFEYLPKVQFNQEQQNQLFELAFQNLQGKKDKILAVQQLSSLYNLQDSGFYNIVSQNVWVLDQVWKLHDSQSSHQLFYYLSTVLSQQSFSFIQNELQSKKKNNGIIIYLLKQYESQLHSGFAKLVKNNIQQFLQVFIIKSNDKDFDFDLFPLILRYYPGIIDFDVFDKIMDTLYKKKDKISFFSLVNQIFAIVDQQTVLNHVNKIYEIYLQLLSNNQQPSTPDLLEGLKFSIIYFEKSVIQNIQLILEKFIIVPEITEQLVEIIHDLINIKQIKVTVTNYTFQKLCIYLTSNLYQIQNNKIILIQPFKQKVQLNQSLSFYLDVFSSCLFQFDNLLEFLQDNFLAYCYNEDSKVRLLTYKILLKAIFSYDKKYIVQNIISRIIDQLCAEQSDYNITYTLQEFISNVYLHQIIYQFYLDQMIALIYTTSVDIQYQIIKLLNILFNYDESGLKSQILREHFFFCLNCIYDLKPDLNKIKFLSICLNEAPSIFLVYQPVIVKKFAKVNFKNWDEEVIIAVIQAFGGLFQSLKIDIGQDIDGYMEQLRYLIQSDNDNIIQQLLVALQRIVRSQGTSIVYYLLIPELFNRLVHFIRNNKSPIINLEAIKALVILGPVNSSYSRLKFEKKCIDQFFNKDQSYSDMILIKYLKQSENQILCSHGLVIFDPVNQQITDLNSVIFNQENLNFNTNQVIQRILSLIYWCLKNDTVNAKISSVIALRKVVQAASQQNLKLNIINHIQRISDFLKVSNDIEFQIKVIQNLVHITKYIPYLLPFTQQIIIESVLVIYCKEDLKVQVLTLIEEISFNLNDSILYNKQQIFQCLFQNFEEKSDILLATRTLTTIIVLKKQIASEIHLLIPQILKSISYFRDKSYVDKALDIVMRVFCYFENGKQFSNLIYQTLSKLFLEGYYVTNYVVVCSIFDFQLLYFIVSNEKLFKSMSQQIQILLQAIKLLDERDFIIDPFYLMGCFHSMQQSQCPIYLNYPLIKLDISDPEKLAKQLIQNQMTVQLNLNQPYEFGSLFIHIKEEIQQTQSDIWVTPQCNNNEQWLQWFQTFIAKLIQQSQNKYIASCFNLASLSSTNQQILINQAIFEFLQNDKKRISRLNLISIVTKKIFQNSVPFNIQLCFMDLIDFLDRNNVDISYLMNYDTMAELSDKYQAYSRSLRVRELLYEQSSSLYVDVLFKNFKRLYYIDSSKGLLKIEQDKLDKQFLLTLGKLAKQYIKYLQGLPLNSEYEEIIQFIDKYDLSNFQIQFQIITENQLYLENMFLQNTQITAENVIQTILLQFSEYFHFYTNISKEEIDRISDYILMFILTKLKQLFIQVFNPKPAWFEAAYEYNQAINLYNQQQSFIEQFLNQETPQTIQKNPKLISQLKDSFKEYYMICLNKISAQFNLGNYNQLLSDIEAFRDFTSSIPYLEPYKKQQYIEKFNSQIAKFAVQALIDTDSNEASLWLEKMSDRQESTKLLFKVILDTKNQNYKSALDQISHLKDLLSKQIQTSIQENYDRAYEQLIDFLQVVELHEANLFLNDQQALKQNIKNETEKIIIEKQNSHRIQQLQQLWSRRLANIRQDIEFWNSIIRIRKLVIPPEIDYYAYVCYANQALKSGRIYLARNILESLFEKKPQNMLRMFHNNNKQYSVNSENLDVLIPRLEINSVEIIYSYSKLLFKDYKIEHKIAGYVHLSRLSQQLEKNHQLTQKIFFKLAEMLFSLRTNYKSLKDDDLHESLVNNIYRIFSQTSSNSVTSDPTDSDIYSSTISQLSDSSKTFTDKPKLIKTLLKNQTMLCFNTQQETSLNEEILAILEKGALIDQNNKQLSFRAAEVSFQLYEEQAMDLTISSISSNVQKPTSNLFMNKTIQYLFQSIENEELRIQAGLQIINIISQYDLDEQLESLVIVKMQETPVEYWLPVLPQLTLYAVKFEFKYQILLQQIILSLGIKFPQEVLTLLYCNANTDNIITQNQLIQIIDIIIRNSKDLAVPLLETLQELNKSSQSTFERTYDECQLFISYLQDNKMSEFFDAFTILIQEFNINSQIPMEMEFNQTIYPKLLKIWNFFKSSILYQFPTLSQDLISQFIDLSADLQEHFQIKHFPLASVSPYLSQLKTPNFNIFGSNTIKVARFLPRLNIIPSKQRPRKIAIQALDGEVYAYLLKGKEDLRQDERVMQFLSFMNQIFQQKRTEFISDLTVQHYKVVPLSANSGLIFWVPGTRSLQEIVVSGRQETGVSIDLEMAQIAVRAGNYAALSLQQRVDAMQFQRLQTTANDLRNWIFAISQSSENFIEKRSPYIATLAIMSAIGHILGLGDRHPGNILLFKDSCRVLHIDYGDAFWLAQKRDIFPEKVPFRLTRVLEKAFDACGVYGYFENVIGISLRSIRSNQSYILTIFRDFIGVEDLNCMRDKINGHETWGEFSDEEEQGKKLISVARNLENICQGYGGWAPQW